MKKMLLVSMLQHSADLVKRVEPDLAECVQNGLLVESAGIYGNVIRFLAPLVITDEQLEAGLDILEKAVAKFSKEK